MKRETKKETTVNQVRSSLSDSSVSRILENVVNKMLEGLQVISGDWRYLYVNDTVCRQGQSTREQLLGRTMMECYPGIDQTPLWKQLRRSMEERVSVQFENEFTFPNGPKGMFLLYIHPVDDEGIMILSVDMSAKERVLMESIGDGVVAIDENWNIILWNRAATTITGWSKEEALGKPFRTIVKFVHEHDRSENILFISDAMLSGEVRSMENHTLLIRKDGTEIPIGDSAAPIIDPDRKISGAIVVFRDASAERKAMLIRSSFAYASHQLLTPVNKALWSLEESFQEKDPAMFKKKVDLAYSATRSTHKLVSALMELSEIDQHMLLPKRDSVAVAQVVEEVTKKLAKKAKEHGVQVVLTSIVSEVMLSTDKKLLARAIQEVIDNAIEYGIRGNKVLISASVHDRDLVFEIKDEGIGIPSEQQALIFTKFFRGQNIPKESVGAGLGLYICREYVQLLDGKVWFRSNRAMMGTTFYISIPLTV